ncbi:cation channel sperm-associated protein subunit beta-like [Dendronephthya gigantea]|uniref:cation channel sperm-associated protein subunit beta-like n=1 Tax=Dendronephthya gigantea TaxID=151771 RepID=UPI00106DD195|nr:cation channel sperm-associated protein subunit beta-like [Dendronephthya gigantea]
MSLDELKQCENRLFLENEKNLTVFCRLVDKQNWSLARSDELNKKYISSGVDDILFEPWFVTVELGMGLGCYVGVTYGAFVPETTLWFDVYFEVSTPVTLISSFANGDIKLQYTPYCLDFHAERYVVLVVSQDSHRHFVFPPWYFSKNSIATDIQFHSWSNTLFVYGSEVWKSRDGGNSFKQLTDLRSPHIISAVSFPQYGDKVVALTNHGNVLNGRIGISRLIAIHHQTLSGPLDFIVVDELESMKGLSRYGDSSIFGNYSIEKIDFESYQKHFCFDHLLLQFIGHREFFIFVATPFEQSSNQASSTSCFRSSVVKQVLKSRLGGSGHISEVVQLNQSTGYYTKAKGEIIKDFVGLTPISAPVLNSDLQLRLFSSTFHEAIYELSIDGGGWSSHDVGRSVVLANGLSILLVKYIDASTIYGLPPPGISPSILPRVNQMSGTWQMYDLSSATVLIDKIDSISISYSMGVFKATTNFAFTNSHVGKVLMVHGDNHGVIESASTGVVSFQNGSPLKVGDFTEWKLLEPRVYSSDPENGYGMWWLEEESCSSFPIVTPKRYKTLYHLDTQDGVTLQFAILAQHLETLESEISIHVSNPSLFFIRGAHEHYETNHTLEVSLTRRPLTTGLSQMSFSIPYLSLKCPSVSNVITVHGGCPPSKRLVFQYPITFSPNVFLRGTPTDGDGVLRRYKLPANYRPPSSRGVGIPMSSNLYNVHPEKPPYKERFEISRRTRVYKQCSGKSYRRHCDCRQGNITMSRLVAYSDCISTVYRLLYGEIFRPNFSLVEDDAITKHFIDPYYIVELNQRSDFQILNSTTFRIANHDSSITALQDRLNSSLEFTGGGLFHFRAYAVKEGYTLCDLTDEFILFIDDLPLPNPSRDVVRFTTAMLFVMASFFAYLWYLYYSDQRDQNRVFPD